MFELTSHLTPSGDQPQAIEALYKGLESGRRYQILFGVTGSGKTFTMAHLIAKAKRPALILAPNKTLAAQLFAEMKVLFPNGAVEYFVSYYDYYRPEAYLPSSDTYIEKDSAINDQIEQLRLGATKALLEHQDTIVVASVSAIYGLGNPSSYREARLPLQVGTRYPRAQLLQNLARIQYRRRRGPALLDRGTFRVSGEYIDLFPAEEENLVLRLSFFGEELESLVKTAADTGEVLGTLSSYVAYPKTHYISSEAQIKSAQISIRKELEEVQTQLLQQGRLVEAQRLSERVQRDLELLQEAGVCSGIENYSRHFTGLGPGEPPPTLLEYFPEDGLLFIDESHVTLPQLRAMYRGDRSRKESLVAYGFRLPSAFDNRPLKFEEFESTPLQTIFVSATPGAYEFQKAKGAVVEQVIRPTGLLDPTVEVRPTHNQMQDLLEQAKPYLQRGDRVCVLTLTKRMAEDLSHYLEEGGVKTRYLHSQIDTVERSEILREFRKGTFEILVGVNLLREGIDLPELGLMVVLDADKEGFLRSASALIQMVGRVARNVAGHAVFYGDVITDSMRQAMEETQRRRERQREHNRLHGQAPTPLGKPLLPSLLDQVSPQSASKPNSVTTPSVRQLKRCLKQHVARLEFEEAIQIREQIKQLQSGARARPSIPDSDSTSP